MKQDFKYLLISDSYHPEVRHVAKYLAGIDEEFLYVSGLVFRERKKNGESRTLRLQNKYVAFYSKRSIALGKRGKLVTSGKFADILFFSTYRNILKLPRLLHNYFLEYLRNIWTGAIARTAQSYIQGIPKIIIVLGEWDISPRENDTLVTIMFHGDSRLEHFWKEEACKRWPDWSDTWTIVKKEEIKLTSFKRVEVHASSFTANLSKIHSTRENLEPTKIVIPIAPVTKNTKDGWSKVYSAPSKRKVLFLGSWTLRKGLPDLLAAFNMIEIDERPELHIAGSGNILNSHEIEGLKLDSRVFLYNSPNSGQVKELFHLADILILPSYYEGFGIVILEAMSFGIVPIVSRNTAGPDIFAQSELANFLINPGDIKLIQEHLIELNTMSNADLGRLGRIAVDLAREFDFESYGKSVLVNISNIVEGS